MEIGCVNSEVLSLLGGDQHIEAGNEGGPTDERLKLVPPVQVSDLISTDDTDDVTTKASTKNLVDERSEDLTSPPLIDNLFGGAPISNVSISRKKNDDDPFADVSFHVAEEEHKDIFSGLTVDKKSDFDIFGSNSGNAQADDLMAGLSLSGANQDNLQTGASGVGFQGTAFINSSRQQSELPSNGTFNGMIGSNAYYPMASMQYNMQPNMMFNPAFAAQSMNYGAMGAFIAQQQLLFQNMGNINSGYGNAAGIATDGGFVSPLPDIFQISNNPVQSHSTIMSTPKKEETKAFDFISEHMSAARDSKRIH